MPRTPRMLELSENRTNPSRKGGIMMSVDAVRSVLKLVVDDEQIANRRVGKPRTEQEGILGRHSTKRLGFSVHEIV